SSTAGGTIPSAARSWPTATTARPATGSPTAPAAAASSRSRPVLGHGLAETAVDQARQGRRERGVLAETGMRAKRVSPGFGTRATEDAAARSVYGRLRPARAGPW